MTKHISGYGGGTGLLTVYKALLEEPDILFTAIVTTSDGRGNSQEKIGGSTAILKENFDIPGVGDLKGFYQLGILGDEPHKQAMRYIFGYRFKDSGLVLGDGMNLSELSALSLSERYESDADEIMEQVMRHYKGLPWQHRLDISNGEISLDGHSMGNLLILYCCKSEGGIAPACELLNKELGIRGRILPATTNRNELVAVYADGTTVSGEYPIGFPEAWEVRPKIINVIHEPKAEINPDAKKASKDADVCILGPGRKETSIRPSAVHYANYIGSNGKPSILIFPLMINHDSIRSRDNRYRDYGSQAEYLDTIQRGEVILPSVLDYVNDIRAMGLTVTHIILNTTPIPEKVAASYVKEHSFPYKVSHRDIRLLEDLGYEVIPGDFLSIEVETQRHSGIFHPHTEEERYVVRHNPDALREAIMSVI